MEHPKFHALLSAFSNRCLDMPEWKVDNIRALERQARGENMVDKTMNEDKPLSIDEVPAEMRVIGETEDGRRIAVDADIPMKLHISLEEDATVFVEMPDPMEEEDAEDGWPEEEDGPFDPDAIDLEDCEECSIKDECDAYAEEFEEQSVRRGVGRAVRERPLPHRFRGGAGRDHPSVGQ